jgi:GrpB-like predicted nucleotidyltransferase (UPF0157 family)
MPPPEEPVTLTAYDELWPERFAEEHATLSRVLDKWLVGAIEHVGSTAVPGLIAKPVIDIMAGVESLEASRGAITAAGKIGYCYFPYKADSMHWFCKPSPSHRTHHLHLVPFESRLWLERLAFRDYLRTHSEIASEYAELKHRLAEQYRFDREAYTEAKSPFIERIVKLALSVPPA